MMADPDPDPDPPNATGKRFFKGNTLVHIGKHTLNNIAVLAPMAGICDQPFRELCQRHGAGSTCAEMLTADWRLWASKKSSTRLPSSHWAEPRIVQIAGTEPEQLAEAARRCIDQGAQIIDINMGCPAKKVCKKDAGSALLKDESLVARILSAVVNASNVPVTLKMRTGWSPHARNAATIARIAEHCGIEGLAIHGRTRACRFDGTAEYDTIAEVVRRVNIPVFANGDIESAEQAVRVLTHTGAAGVMIGRGAQGQPWLFDQIYHRLETSEAPPAPRPETVIDCITSHIQAIRAHYSGEMALGFSRKHVSVYLKRLDFAPALRKSFNLLATAGQQDEFLARHLRPESLEPALAA